MLHAQPIISCVSRLFDTYRCNFLRLLKHQGSIPHFSKKIAKLSHSSVFDQKTAQSWSIFPEKNTKLSHRPHSGSNNFSAKHHYNFSEALISTPPGVAKHSHRPLPNKSLCQLFVPTRSQKYSCVSRLFDTYRCNF